MMVKSNTGWKLRLINRSANWATPHFWKYSPHGQEQRTDIQDRCIQSLQNPQQPQVDQRRQVSRCFGADSITRQEKVEEIISLAFRLLGWHTTSRALAESDFSNNQIKQHRPAAIAAGCVVLLVDSSVWTETRSGVNACRRERGNQYNLY